MLEYIKKTKLRFVLSVILSIVVAFSSLYAIYIRSTVVNQVVNKNMAVFQTIILMLVIIAISEIGQLIIKVSNAKLIKTWNMELGSNISNKIEQIPYATFHELEVGNYVSWYTMEMDLVTSYIFQNVLGFLNKCLLLVGSGVLLFLISWKVLLFSFVLFIIYIFLFGKFGNKISALYQSFGMKLGMFNQTLQEYLSGYDVLKNFGLLAFLKQKIYHAQLVMEDLYYDISKNTAFATLVGSSLKYFFEAIMFVFTAYLIRNKEITLGMLLVTPFILRIFLDSFVETAEYVLQYKYASNIKKKLENFEEVQIMDYPKMEETLLLDNISFQYKEKEVIKDMTLLFEKNKKYALIGESGSGKSTILKLILGRLSPTKGNVLIDQKKTLDYDKIIDFSKQIAYLRQENYFFDLSIRDNITLGKKAEDKELFKILEEVKIAELVRSLEQGLDTKIGTLGSKLSGGERQRLALAQALFHNVPILILDEATSAVDKQTTKEIEQLLLKKQDKTLILISHHLNDEIRSQFDAIYEIKKVESEEETV